MQKFYFIKYWLLLIFLITLVSQGNTQSFSFNPSGQYVQTIPLNTYSSHYVFMENLTGGILTLGWERIFLDFPENWEYSLCDNGGCYSGIPDSGVMAPVSGTLEAYLKLTVNALDYVGTGTVVFRVYDFKQPEIADTVSFTIHAVLTGENELSKSDDIRINPNPASDFINITTGLNQPAESVLTDLNGRTIAVNELNPGNVNKLDISGLAKGFYFFTIKKKSGDIIKKKVVVQ